jgi:hypothetical protein
MIGAESANAVWMQVSPLATEKLDSTAANSKNAVMRKAAAYAAGFITAPDLDG